MKKYKRFVAMLIAGILVSVSAMTQSASIAVQAEENVQSMEEQSAETEKVEQDDVTEEREETSEEKQRQLEEETKTSGETKEEPATEQAEKAEAQSSAAQESGAELSINKIEALEDVSALSAPTFIDVTMTVDQPGVTKYNHLILKYRCAEKNSVVTVEKDGYSDNNGWDRNGNVHTISAEINEYTPTGTYTLEEILIQANDFDIYVTYSYDAEKKKFIGNTDVEGFAYHGEADFCVTESSDEDNIAPEVTSVKRLSEGPFDSTSMIKYEVGVIEEESGVKSIEMSFLCEENASVWTFNCRDYIEFGTKSIVLSPYTKGDSVGEYKIQKIEIEDGAGNHTVYEVTADDTVLKGTVNGGEKSITVPSPHNSFVTEYVDESLPKIKSVKFADDVKSDNMAAGDTFHTIVTVYNDGKQKIKIIPENSWISWYDKHVGDGVGDALILQPGEEQELTYETVLNPYTTVGSGSLRWIELRGCYTNGAAFYMRYDNEGNKLNAINGNGKLADQIPYNGELDFQITTADNPDTEAPLIESVSVEQGSLKAPGPITFRIKTKGKEIAPINYISLNFRDVNISGNALHFGAEYNGMTEVEQKKISYSEEEGCYYYKTELNAKVVKGTYVLEEAIFSDAAENSCSYYINEKGELQNETEAIPATRFTVSEAQETDMDFKRPLLKSAELITQEVEMSSDFDATNVQVIVEVEDEKGLSAIEMRYVGMNGEELNLKSENVTKQEDGKYLCTLALPRYCMSGEYTLWGIDLWDQSVRTNLNWYGYDEETQSFQAGYLEDQDDVKSLGSMTLTVLPAKDYVVTDIASADEKVQEIEDKGTIVVKGLYTELENMPKLSEEFITQAKNKNLNIIIPDEDGTSEIVIQGQDIPDSVTGDMTFGVLRGEMVSEEIKVGSKEDDVYYPITVMASNLDIPVTLRIRLDQEFLDLCGKEGISFSKGAAFDVNEPIAENLQADENGYVEIQMEKGWSSANVRLRTTSQEMKFCVSGKKQDTSDVMPGDIDGDGKVAMTDLMQCLHHLSGSALLSGTKYEAADINGDGSITMVDLMKILHYVSGRSDTLA